MKNPNQGNLKIEKAGSRPQNRDQVYGTPKDNQPSQHNADMLDDDLNRW